MVSDKIELRLFFIEIRLKLITFCSKTNAEAHHSSYFSS